MPFIYSDIKIVIQFQPPRSHGRIFIWADITRCPFVVCLFNKFCRSWFFLNWNMALFTGNTAAISFITHIQYLASISFKSDQEILRKVGPSSFKCDWFIYNSYQIVFFTHTIWIWYYIICFRFVVGSKKSNDARAEEMNLCNQNI